MTLRLTSILSTIIVVLTVCPLAVRGQEKRPSVPELRSPNGRLSLTFKLTASGEPLYSLSLAGKPVVRDSKLGLEFKDIPALADGFVVEKVDTKSVDESWDPVWGELEHIRDNHRELAVTLSQPSHANHKLVVRFRLFDDGLGFRYEIPEQPDVTNVVLSGERTEFNMAGDHKTFWIPGDYDSNEQHYTTTKLSEIATTDPGPQTEIAVQHRIAPNCVQTPLMMKSDDGVYVNVHEAALTNYPAMYLLVDGATHGLKATLAPDPAGNLAYLQTPTHTPWRTIVTSDKATDILASKLILNLNEPSKIKDTSWIKPTKFVGVWWMMQVGTATWSYSDTGNVKIGETDFAKLTPSGKHGATTERVKRYIDFAAAHKIGAVLVEGWNVGWEDWFGKWKENVFDFVTPYPDFDVDGLRKYAESKGVKIIMHHETSGSATNYERRMDDAFKFMRAHGYDSVKTGYVGKIVPRGEYHDGQWMVQHYVRVAEKAASYKVMVDSHESVRPTGVYRTWPNWLACEAARGNEFNAFSATGLPPDHETILPFTRLMGGPMDFTPGIFQIKLDRWVPGKKERVHTTLAKQLALYVTMFSPVQMAADLPEAYEEHLDAFKFIEDVAVDWSDSKILEAEPGDYVTIARKAKGGESWFVGAITDENGRTAHASLDFLDSGKRYVATVYGDAPDADWDKNPMAYKIASYVVDAKTALDLRLAPGGGAAVSIRPATDADVKTIQPYKAGM